MKRMIFWTAVLGVAALFIGIVGSSPAKADDDYHIYRDIADVRRDEARLRDMERQRSYEAREHDWGQVRILDRQITDLRWHIAHDRRDIHNDIDQTRRDRYRDDYRRDRNREDYYRNHNRDDYRRDDRNRRDRDSNRQDDGSYRHHE